MALDATHLLISLLGAIGLGLAGWLAQSAKRRPVPIRVQSPSRRR